MSEKEKTDQGNKKGDREEQDVRKIFDSELHSEVVPLISHAIVFAGQSSSSPVTSVVIAQDVLFYVMANCVKPDGYEEVLQGITETLDSRLKSLRLALQEPAGTA